MGQWNKRGLITAPLLAGVERLANTPLTVNGKVPAVDYRYVPIDASLTSWPARDVAGSMPISGGGSDPIFDPAPHISDVAVRTPGKIYVGSWPGDPLTGKDVIHEFVAMPPTPPGAAKFWVNNTTNGYQLYHTSVNFGLIWYQSSAAAVFAYAVGLPGAFVHLMFSLDWGGSTNGYLHYNNGVYSGKVDDVTAITTLPNTGIQSSDTSNPTVGFGAQYSLAGLLPGGASNRTVMDALAKQRAALWMGATALHGHGSLTPTTL